MTLAHFERSAAFLEAAALLPRPRHGRCLACDAPDARGSLCDVCRSLLSPDSTDGRERLYGADRAVPGSV